MTAAEQMDRMYRRQRRIYDASRKFYLLGRDDMIRALQPPRGGAVLEIGCGTARNLAHAARVYPDAEFFGLDVSEQMLITARRTIDRDRLSDRVNLARGDATCFEPCALFRRTAFDRVFISYALSMMPPWRAALDHAFDCVAPRGSLHIVDFGDFSGLPAPFGAGMRAWLGAFGVTPRIDLDSALQGAASRRGLQARSVPKFRGYAIHAVAAPGRSSSDEGAHDIDAWRRGSGRLAGAEPNPAVFARRSAS